MQFMLLPLIQQQRDPVGSMGNDSALACLSDQPRMLYDYFKQLFAQVTNPAIDSIREEIIMSLECYIGPEANLLETTRRACPPPAGSASDSDQRRTGGAQAHRAHPGGPRLADARRSTSRGRRVEGKPGLVDGARSDLPGGRAGDRRRLQPGRSVRSRDQRRSRSRVSALLAAGAVHHHLVRQAKRTRIGIVLETGEAREVHHHCLLIGYGADAINPYLAFEALWQAQRDGLLPAEMSDEQDRRRLSQGRRQGHAEGHGQDGHLDAAILQGSADLRSGRLAGRSHRSLLRRDRQSHSRASSFDVLAEELIASPRRSAIPSVRKTSCRRCPTSVNSTGVPTANGTCGIRQSIADLQVAARTNSRRSLPAIFASTPTRTREPAVHCAVC